MKYLGGKIWQIQCNLPSAKGFFLTVLYIANHLLSGQDTEDTYWKDVYPEVDRDVIAREFREGQLVYLHYDI